jgi:hypothetical protein
MRSGGENFFMVEHGPKGRHDSIRFLRGLAIVVVIGQPFRKAEQPADAIWELFPDCMTFHLQ